VPQINNKRGITGAAPVSRAANQTRLFLLTLNGTEFRNMKHQLDEVYVILDGRETPLTAAVALWGLWLTLNSLGKAISI
jgi:hypothetical protein